MELWVARDGDGDLYLYDACPSRDNFEPDFYSSNSIRIDSDLLPDLKWEDEPIKVKITGITEDK